jgi:peptidoglycan/xylan/chitin deacetylase (PgdA/CDA1 family)
VSSFSRRQFLKLGLAGLAGLVAPTQFARAGDPGGPITAVFSAKPQTPTVALTFDDGYFNVATLLDKCQEADVRLTLFPIGKVIEARPEVWQRAVAEGHEIGCHSYFHQPLGGQPYEVVANELELFLKVARRYLGNVPVRYFRPPYGSGWNGEALKAAARDFGMTVVMWNRVSPPSPTPGVKPTADDVLEAFRRQARSGDIFLYHFLWQEVGAFADIVTLCKGWGWRVGTVSEMLGD